MFVVPEGFKFSLTFGEKTIQSYDLEGQNIHNIEVGRGLGLQLSKDIREFQIRFEEAKSSKEVQS